MNTGIFLYSGFSDTSFHPSCSITFGTWRLPSILYNVSPRGSPCELKMILFPKIYPTGSILLHFQTDKAVQIHSHVFMAINETFLRQGDHK